jgi:hypothetical protein
MTRLATLVCASVLGFACTAEAGSERAPQQASGKLVLTARDHGRTVTIRVGRTGELRVPSRLHAPVRTFGKSVVLTRIESFAPTATQAWELRAMRTGSTVITGPRSDGSRFRITVQVIR